jgi:hypothetical protein
MEITLKIQAPEIVDALNALATAIAGNLEVLLRIPAVQEIGGAAIAPPPVTEKLKNDTKPAKTVNETAETVNETAETETFTLEQVRAELANLSRAGKQTEVKALLNSFGVKKLTEIPAEKYPELMKEAEAI